MHTPGVEKLFDIWHNSLALLSIGTSKVTVTSDVTQSINSDHFTKETSWSHRLNSWILISRRLTKISPSVFQSGCSSQIQPSGISAAR